MTHDRDTAGMEKSASQRTEKARERALDAIERLKAEGLPIDFQSVSNASGCSRPFLYGQADISRMIKTAKSKAQHLKAPAERMAKKRIDDIAKLTAELDLERDAKNAAKRKSVRIKVHFERYREAFIRLIATMELNVDQNDPIILPKSGSAAADPHEAVKTAAALLRFAQIKPTLRRIQAITALETAEIIQAIPKSSLLAREMFSEIAAARMNRR